MDPSLVIPVFIFNQIYLQTFKSPFLKKTNFNCVENQYVMNSLNNPRPG